VIQITITRAKTRIALEVENGLTGHGLIERLACKGVLPLSCDAAPALRLARTLETIPLHGRLASARVRDGDAIEVVS
jgi:hypothetical protein